MLELYHPSSSPIRQLEGRSCWSMQPVIVLYSRRGPSVVGASARVPHPRTFGTGPPIVDGGRKGCGVGKESERAGRTVEGLEAAPRSTFAKLPKSL